MPVAGRQTNQTRCRSQSGRSNDYFDLEGAAETSKRAFMSTRYLLNRLEKVEERMFPKRDDGTLTLEELCRAIWRQDRKGLEKITSGEYCSLRHFIRQFEREDSLDASRTRMGTSFRNSEARVAALEEATQKAEHRK